MASGNKHHHAARIKAKRKNYFGANKHNGGMMVKTACLCSCHMCANRRSMSGMTIQERRNLEGADSQHSDHEEMKDGN